jgi:hypothetical protein
MATGCVLPTARMATGCHTWEQSSTHGDVAVSRIHALQLARELAMSRTHGPNHSVHGAE